MWVSLGREIFPNDEISTNLVTLLALLGASSTFVGRFFSKRNVHYIAQPKSQQTLCTSQLIFHPLCSFAINQLLPLTYLFVCLSITFCLSITCSYILLVS
jgi:hypothetical protein